jgi:hypothetical protein
MAYTPPVNANALFCLAAAFPASAFAHGGGLDAYGCHNDHKHGGCHCHRGPFAGEAFASKAQMLDAFDGKRPNAPPAERPPIAPAAPPSPTAADCATIKDPAARLACHDKLSPPR